MPLSASSAYAPEVCRDWLSSEFGESIKLPKVHVTIKKYCRHKYCTHTDASCLACICVVLELVAGVACGDLTV